MSDNPWHYQEPEELPEPTPENVCDRCGGGLFPSFQFEKMSLFCPACKRWIFKRSEPTLRDYIGILVIIVLGIGAMVSVVSSFRP